MGGSLPTVGLSPCAWFTFENVYRRDPNAIEAMVAVLRQILEGLQARGYRALLIPTMNPEDREVCERLLQSGVDLLETDPLTPSEIQGAIGSLHALISMRLHPVIFAFNVGTPFVALNYASKVAEFCLRAGLEDRLVDLGDGWGEETLRRFDSTDELALRSRMANSHARLAAELEPAYQALWTWLGPR